MGHSSKHRLVGIPEVSRRLQLDPANARALSRSGLLGPEEKVGRQILVTDKAVNELEQRTTVVSPHPEAIVIRLGPYTPEDEPKLVQRQWRGYKKINENDPQEVQAFSDSIRGWWPLSTSAIGQTAVWTFCGFVVAVHTLGEVDHDSITVRRFTLKPASRSALRAFKNKRLITPRGGMIYFLDENEGSTRDPRVDRVK